MELASFIGKMGINISGNGKMTKEMERA